MSDQNGFDKLAFAKLVSNFTGVSASKLDSFIENNNIAMVFEHPTAIGITQQQLKKFEQLKELSSLYNNLKDHKSEYCINTSSKAGEYFRNYFCGIKDKEKFVCAFLNTANNIMGTEVMSTGTVNEAPVYPREIVKKALMYDAQAIMISHNHPGGRLSPSTDDIAITNNIAHATESVRIQLLDHIIVAGDRYYSFKEHDEMPKQGMKFSEPHPKQKDIAVEEDEDEYEQEM
ncbi:MAG TPA: JAB domain-containing protein [Ruminiclostridium sp.]